jgi:hypothetical protein
MLVSWRWAPSMYRSKVTSHGTPPAGRMPLLQMAPVVRRRVRSGDGGGREADGGGREGESAGAADEAGEVSGIHVTAPWEAERMAEMLIASGPSVVIAGYAAG